MYPFISRNIFRLQEKLLGRDSFSILHDLNKSQYWTRSELERLRLKRLKNLIDYAYSNTPYWKSLMDENGISPHEIREIEDLKRFPILEKETLREKKEEMVFGGEGKRVLPVRTSGSTNEALEFYTSSTREAHINAARMRGHEWAGIKRGEKEMYYWGSPVELDTQGKIKKIRDFLINDGLTNGFELNAQKVKEYFAFWLSWKPKVIFGYPSTFILTIGFAKELKLNPRLLKKNGLKKIVTTSEILLDEDRKNIEKSFGVKVHDSYGLREAGLIGYECDHGTMHTMDEQLILETIDPVTKQRVKGEGELVVTNIVGKAFPVIRYRTGDIVKLEDKRCKCGRSLNSLKISGGRAVEFILTENGRWIVGYSFIYIARSVKGIVKFQVVQEKIGEINFNIVVDKDFPANGVEIIREAAEKRLKSRDKIMVNILGDIKPAASGKYRPVISRVTEERLKRR